MFSRGYKVGDAMKDDHSKDVQRPPHSKTTILGHNQKDVLFTTTFLNSKNLVNESA